MERHTSAYACNEAVLSAFASRAQTTKRDSLLLNKLFCLILLSASANVCCMVLHFCMRPSNYDRRQMFLLASPTYGYFLNIDYSAELLWERSDTFPVTFRRQLKEGGTPLETRREKFRPRETRLPLLLWIDVPRIVRGITLLVVANTIAMNISLRDFANARAAKGKLARRNLANNV